MMKLVVAQVSGKRNIRQGGSGGLERNRTGRF